MARLWSALSTRFHGAVGLHEHLQEVNEDVSIPGLFWNELERMFLAASLFLGCFIGVISVFFGLRVLVVALSVFASWALEMPVVVRGCSSHWSNSCH